MRKFLFALAVLVLVAAAAFFFYLPKRIDAGMNGVAMKPPYTASDRARALHQRLFVADLHDDAFLWSRDLLERHDYGHVDLPRLEDGSVGLQVFATVTKSPRGQNFDSNPSDTDTITALAIAQRWPPRTWNSLLERALYQSERLHAAAAASGGRMQVVHTRAELSDVLKDARPVGGRMAAVLATEGLHPLEGRIENVDRMYDAGFRIMGLTHFFDNEIGGSAHGLTKGGLTPLGKQVVKRLEEKKMIVDLAHASPRVIDDVLAQATRPVIVSHTGVQGTCPGPRNLSDKHIRGIAATGGLIGIGYFNGAVCALDIPAIVKAMRYTADLVGVQHVALGSDFDGATRTAIDTTGLVLITQALLDAHFTDDEVVAIMGGNVRRLLLQLLP
ncbi:dipeptidase [Variovorax sp. Sphag1AA]|uniref:dipeptidase n=1 Tax=Variovorax sp. Sphag1AA TaxID=2587027 RepID=UPI001616B23A|nr:dipeptidase [Variovorax sp. Sphag1AA]MBB3178039.1 microsomal dipeptidase-like Zn-dependent dipeptidase [Variovorax sp. Sphag1AA]